MLPGRQPGVFDHAAKRKAHNDARGWLIQAADGFADERTYQTQIAVAAGSVPSTPGQSDSEAAMLSQRHALDMLAQSDRSGCAMGAAFRSEEHPSELQSLMRISYAVLCLNKKIAHRRVAAAPRARDDGRDLADKHLTHQRTASDDKGSTNEYG